MLVAENFTQHAFFLRSLTYNGKQSMLVEKFAESMSFRPDVVKKSHALKWFFGSTCFRQITVYVSEKEVTISSQKSRVISRALRFSARQRPLT